MRSGSMEIASVSMVAEPAMAAAMIYSVVYDLAFIGGGQFVLIHNTAAAVGIGLIMGTGSEVLRRFGPLRGP